VTGVIRPIDAAVRRAVPTGDADAGAELRRAERVREPAGQRGVARALRDEVNELLAMRRRDAQAGPRRLTAQLASAAAPPSGAAGSVSHGAG
jgi:hypothetical protein